MVIKTSAFSKQKVESLIKHNLRQAPFEELIIDIHNAHIIPINKILQLCRRLSYDYQNKIIVVNQQYMNERQLAALSQETRLTIVQEIFDIYLAQLPYESYIEIIKRLALKFQMDFKYISDSITKKRHQTEIVHFENMFRAGRFQVHRGPEQPHFDFSQVQNFAMTDYTTRLIQQIVGCVENRENVLLIAGTGIGKTYTLDMVARAMGSRLVVINFSGQTEISDMVGGFKPVNLSYLFKELYTSLVELAHALLDMGVDSNKAFLEGLARCYQNSAYEQLIKYAKAFAVQCQKNEKAASGEVQRLFGSTVRALQNFQQLYANKQQFFFKYYDGVLLQAVKNGYYILFDEINLAPAEVLEYVESLLSNDYVTVVDQDRGQDV